MVEPKFSNSYSWRHIYFESFSLNPNCYLNIGITTVDNIVQNPNYMLPFLNKMIQIIIIIVFLTLVCLLSSWGSY